jgi:cell wall assembly regulator SMI1
LTLRDSKPPITSKDIEKTETKLGIQFPAEYKAFLLRHNGGRPAKEWFPKPRNPSDGVLLHYFLAVTREETSSISEHAARFRDRIPAALLPIARTAGGNVICVGVATPHLGKVYLWDHEREEEVARGSKPSWNNVELLASSLGEFVAGLTDIPSES